MPKFEVNQIDVKDDGRVIIYQRPRKDGTLIPTWQMRVSVPNSTGYHRSSTGEKEQAEAIRKALNKYEELYMKVMTGGSLQAITFSSLFKDYEKDLPRMNHQNKTPQYIKERINCVGNYPLRYFGDSKLEEIDKTSFSDYWIWRRENSLKLNPMTGKQVPYEPSPNTLRREASMMRMFFRYAIDKGHMKAVPEMNEPSLDKNRRPTFTLTEWRLLTRRMREWVKEGQKWGGVGRDRNLLQNYILILANCGARMGEVRYLRWNELETKKLDDGTTRLMGMVRGKTGERQVVFNEGTEDYLKRIYDMRREELGENPPPDGFVFCHRDGTPIEKMAKGFNSLLTYCDLVKDNKGQKRTLYSLRHFYATQRLSEEVSPYLLASNMGTSVEMLERHYGQVVNQLVAKEITKSQTDRTPKELGSNEYPFDMVS